MPYLHLCTLLVVALFGIQGCARWHTHQMPIHSNTSQKETKYDADRIKLDLLSTQIARLYDVNRSKTRNDCPKDRVCVVRSKRRVEVMFGPRKFFENEVKLLTPYAKRRLSRLVPALRYDRTLVIQILVRLTKKGDKRARKRLADARAVSVAEYLYDHGIRNEIYAKGCIELPRYDKKGAQIPQRALMIYLYPRTSWLQNPCRHVSNSNF